MKKINIAKLLKDCPKGMELDCLLFNNPVMLDEVADIDEYPCPITVITADGDIETFTKYGQHLNRKDAKCIIFPKGKTTWEGFNPPCKFKDGDIVATNSGNWIGITTGGKMGELMPTYCVIKDNNTFEAYLDVKNTWCFSRLATEEEKQKLFNAIKENGYHWNAETKTIEKLIEPKFKVGDKVRHKNNPNVCFTITSIEEDSYVCGAKTAFWFDDQDKYELVPDKFDIGTLVPFESRVLVRHNKDNKWTGSFFSFIDRDLHSHCYKFVTTADKSYPMMIPFKGNEYLLGKTDDCQDFYKIWE